MLVCLYLLLLLHITEGCTLEGIRSLKTITAYTGGSVLLPCSCTELHRKPETFTWEKFIKNQNQWVKIAPESDPYKERFQLVNDVSSGNLSLLISHLTEDDGGVYRCSLKDNQKYRDLSLTVQGCKLSQPRVDVTENTGESVLLPCSCSELQAKPNTFRWFLYKGSYPEEIFPNDRTNLYTGRVQVFDDPPGNLSLLISHLTLKDGGLYRCEVNNWLTADVHLTLKEIPKRSSTSSPKIVKTTSKPATTTTKPGLVADPETSEGTPVNPVIMISSSVAGVLLLLLLILGAVFYRKRNGQSRGEMEIGEGQTGQRTQQKKQDFTEPLNLTVTPDPTYEAVHTQNDSEVLYAAINPKTKQKKAEEKDEVTYSTLVHGNTVRAADTPVASADTAVYASIKTN